MVCVCVWFWFKRLYFIWLTKGRKPTRTKNLLENSSQEMKQNRAAAEKGENHVVCVCGALLLISWNVQTFIMNIHHHHHHICSFHAKICCQIWTFPCGSHSFCCVLRCVVSCFVLLCFGCSFGIKHSMDQRKSVNAMI